MDISKRWDDRHTCRLFSSTNRDIKAQHIDHMKSVISNMPAQCGIRSNFVLYLGESKQHLKIRQFLLDYCYWMMSINSDTKGPGSENQPIKEHMIPILQAPAIFCVIRTDEPYCNPERNDPKDDISTLAIKEEGIYTGIIMSELMNLGYHIGTFGCTRGWYNNEQGNKKYFKKLLLENYNKELDSILGKYKAWNELEYFPCCSIAFGPELDDDPQMVNKPGIAKRFAQWKNYYYVPNRKNPMPVDISIIKN